MKLRALDNRPISTFDPIFQVATQKSIETEQQSFNDRRESELSETFEELRDSKQRYLSAKVSHSTSRYIAIQHSINSCA